MKNIVTSYLKKVVTKVLHQALVNPPMLTLCAKTGIFSSERFCQALSYYCYSEMMEIACYSHRTSPCLMCA